MGASQSLEEEAGAAFPLEGMLGSSPKSLGHTKSRWLQQRERLAREYGEYAVRTRTAPPLQYVLVLPGCPACTMMMHYLQQ